MLHSIEIRNFQGIKHLKIDKLNRITLIGGKNNTGKTSLLQAMHMLFDDVNADRQNMQCLSPKDFEKIPDELFISRFYNLSIDNFISIKGNYNFNQEIINKTLEIKANKNTEVNINTISNINPNIKNQNISLKNTFSFNISENEIKKDTYLFIYEHLDPLTRQFSTSISIDFGQLEISNLIPIFFFSTNLNLNNTINRFIKVYKQNKRNEAIELLKIIEPSLSNIETIPNINGTTSLYIEINNTRKPVTLMGEGFLRLLDIAMAIVIAENGIVFIDEFENGLHWSVLQKIWKFIAIACEKFNCQIICTTHSQEMINYANQAMQELKEHDFCYIRLAKKNDEIKAYYLNDETIDDALSADLEVR